MESHRGRFMKLLLAFSDIFLVNVGFFIAFWFRFGFSVPQANFEPYIQLIPWLSLGIFVIFYMFGLYTNWRRKSLHNLIYTIVLSLLTFILLTMVLTFWHRGFAFPRSVIVIAFFAQLVLLIGSRTLLWILAKQLYGRKKVLIIGDDVESGLFLADKFLNHDKGWFIVQEFLPVQQLHHNEKKLQEIDVILLSPSLEKKDKGKIISLGAKYGKEVLVVPELFELFLLGAEPQQVDDMLVLSIQPPKLSAGQRLLKRLFDIIVSLAMILLLSPIILLLYILVPLTSPGPAIYKQERLGRDGKPYLIYKFRSMVNDAEKRTGPVLAVDNDPRITPLGRIMRATRLDEIPQLLNVLKGDMSLVGPRPERAYFIERFKRQVPGYSYRMAVKPGITGLAQVMAKYTTTVEDKLRYDLLYIHNYSFALDIKILLQTIRVVLQREQASGVKWEDNVRKKQLMKLLGMKEMASTKE
ncbi:sugar transferase [Bacillaceae bacterium]